MTRRPDRFQESPRHDPAASAPAWPRHAASREPLSEPHSRADKVAREQAALKRELTRVYAQACASCVRKD
ncbi:hypothetical protein [Lysobacter sp. CA199]|uniref:hypothetical protein n=1 Tax=Lysobacter sp. CA199 TaxID=3455608 RepID=UPI003F8D41D8